MLRILILVIAAAGVVVVAFQPVVGVMITVSSLVVLAAVSAARKEPVIEEVQSPLQTRPDVIASNRSLVMGLAVLAGALGLLLLFVPGYQLAGVILLIPSALAYLRTSRQIREELDERRHRELLEVMRERKQDQD